MAENCGMISMDNFSNYCSVMYADSSVTLANYGGFRGMNGRCLPHTVEAKSADQTDITVGCLKATCASNVVTVTIEDTDFTCTDGGSVTVDTTSFAGEVTCPASMENFCNEDNLLYQCQGDCNTEDGVCIGHDQCITFDDYDEAEYELNEDDENGDDENGDESKATLLSFYSVLSLALLI
jgi:hypothetical protein